MGNRDYNLDDDGLTLIKYLMQSAEEMDVRRRARAIYLLHSGEKPAQVADTLSVSVSTIYHWHKRWTDNGVEGLGLEPKIETTTGESELKFTKAKELHGKWVTIRKEPHVRGEYIDQLEPYCVVNFVEIVPDQTNPEWEWLKLSEGNYVNYDYPPTGLRFKLLPAVPDLPIDHYVLTAYDSDYNEIQRKILVELK